MFHPRKIPKPPQLFPHPFLRFLKTLKPGYKFLPDFSGGSSDVPVITRVKHVYYSLHYMTQLIFKDKLPGKALGF